MSLMLIAHWLEAYKYIFCYMNVIDWKCFNIHLHNNSPAIGISVCKKTPVNKELRW